MAYNRLEKLKYRRKLWLQVHLYLGLVAGAILAVVGLTGSILVFYEELQEVFNSEQIEITAPPEGQRIKHSLDEIIAAAETAKPNTANSLRFTIRAILKPLTNYCILSAILS